MRLTPQEADRLAREATERGMTKADLIRTALGLERVDLPPKTITPRQPFAPTPITEKPIDPERQPGLSAIQKLAERLKQ